MASAITGERDAPGHLFDDLVGSITAFFGLLRSHLACCLAILHRSACDLALPAFGLLTDPPVCGCCMDAERLGGKCERDREYTPRRVTGKRVIYGKAANIPAGTQRLSRHSRTSTSRSTSPVSRTPSDSGSASGKTMASFITRRTSSGSPPNRSRESSRSRESCRSRESSVEPVARTPPNPRASGSVLSECFADVTLLKASWRSFELFKYLEEETMNMCINKMKLRTYNAGDKIIKKGSIGISMFFIDLGTARAEIRGHTAQTLKSGDYFGELAFVATCKKFLRDKDDTSAPEQAVRAADVVATSTCRIFQLSVKDFITILQVPVLPRPRLSVTGKASG